MGSDARMSNNVMNQKGLISGWNVFDLVDTVPISLLLCKYTKLDPRPFFFIFLSLIDGRSSLLWRRKYDYKILDKTKVQPDLRQYCHFKHLQLMR